MTQRNRREQLQGNRLLVIALVAVVAYLLYDRWALQSRLRTPEELAARANELKHDADIKQFSQMVVEERHLARDEFTRLQALVREVDQQLNMLELTTAAATTKLQAALETSSGAPIAANRTSLEQLQTLLAEYQPSEVPLGLLRQRYKELIEPVSTALEQEHFDKHPDPTLVTRLQALADQVQALTASQAAFDQRFAALAPNVTVAVGTPDDTLAEALRELAKEQAEALNEQARQVAEQVRQEYQAKFEEQAREAQRQLEEARLANEQLLREEQLKAEQLAAELERRQQAEATEDKLRVEQERIEGRKAAELREQQEQAFNAALPEIRRYLVPFITAGHKQLERGRWVHTTETKPLSLSALQAANLLSNDITGHMNFYAIAASSNNDRSNGIFRANYIGGAVRPELVPDVVKAQQLLEEFGDLLVEKELLLP